VASNEHLATSSVDLFNEIGRYTYRNHDALPIHPSKSPHRNRSRSWRRTLPAGVRKPRQDLIRAIPDERSFRIAAGWSIRLNAWAIEHVTKTPSRSWPEGYEGGVTTGEESKDTADVQKRDYFAFRSGQRICPGYPVVERWLSIAIMRPVWAFGIVPAEDAKMPLDPRDYLGMLGNSAECMPVVLRVGSEAKKRVTEDEEKERENYIQALYQQKEQHKLLFIPTTPPIPSPSKTPAKKHSHPHFLRFFVVIATCKPPTTFNCGVSFRLFLS